MPTVRGQGGILATTGILLGTAVVTAGVPAGASTLGVAALPGETLRGMVTRGQTFTVEGVGGTYEVVGDWAMLPARANQIPAIPFTPVALEAFPADAEVHFDTTILAELRQWQLLYEAQPLRTTVCRQPAQTYRPGLTSWRGAAQGLCDYHDGSQQVILDALVRTPGNVVAFLTLGNVEDTSTQPFWVSQSVVVTNAVATSPLDDLVSIAFAFQAHVGPPALPPIPVMAWQEPWDWHYALTGPSAVVWSEAWDWHHALTGSSTLLWREAWERYYRDPAWRWTEIWYWHHQPDGYTALRWAEPWTWTYAPTSSVRRYTETWES